MSVLLTVFCCAVLSDVRAGEPWELANVSVETKDRSCADAADELVKHLSLVSGARPAAGGKFRLVLGEKAPGAGDVEPHTSYGRRVGDTVYLWGDDGERRHGTLFAVYGFLETICGIRWAFPGDDGIVFRPQTAVEVPADWSWTYRPPLMKSEMRGAGRGKFDEAEFARWQKYLPDVMRGNDAFARQEAVDNLVWNLRMRHQTREPYSLGHAFGKWHERFRETHPEYLAMNEDGTRGIRKGNPRHGKLCLANEAVVDQIVADWVKGGKGKYLNACPNDAKGYCRCEKCRALDCPLSDDEPFNLHKTDRYVNFWNRLAKKLVAIRPDVVLCTYIYESYREPPRREKLQYGENMLFGVVLRQDDDNDACIEGWRKAGMKRFVLRPNSLCYHGILPRGFEKFLYDNFQTALRNGMVGCDYDGAFRRVMDFESYAVARVIADPTLSFGTVEREFLSQYGAAAPVMKEYYDRIRTRGEVARIARQNLPASEKEVAGDDSQLYKGMLEANPVSELERDLEVLRRAASVPGLSAVERRRVEMRCLMGEHALKTGVFLHARDTRPAKEFAQLGLDLLAYRTGICRKLSEHWGQLFRAFRCEVHWWRHMRRELKAKHPEMELND